jgi:outer membrane protein assembly factor BamB
LLSLSGDDLPGGRIAPPAHTIETAQRKRNRNVPMSTRTTLALLLAVCATSAAGPATRPADMANYVGYHGPDGTQVYPGSNPPIQWDGQSGKNILWQTPLPYLGYGGPIVVRGRVFAVSEPGFRHDFPVLTCLDADTGKILWERQVNHLPVAIPDDAQRAKVAQVWHDHVAWRREFLQLRRELNAATGPDRAAVEARMKAKGMFVEDRRSPAPDNASPLSHWRLGKEHPEISKAGLFFDAWRTGFGGWYPGATFPTPCTDGQFIYIATAWRSYACYDPDGNLRWLKWFASTGKGDHSDGCGNNRSPLIWKDLFIADNNAFVRALDRRTGQLVWEVSRTALGIGQHEVGSPVLFRAGGADLLWCNGPVVIRLPDGKPFKVEGWRSTGMMVVADTDQPDTLYLTGGGEHGGWVDKGHGENPPPAAIRIAFDGQSVRAAVLWTGVNGAAMGSNCGTLAYHAGKVYFWSRGGLILDARTGKLVAGTPGKGAAQRAAPNTTQIYAIAAGRIYGLGAGEHGSEKRKDDQGAKVLAEVYSLDGKKLAENALWGPKLEGAFSRSRDAPFGAPPPRIRTSGITASGSCLG